MFNPLTNRKTFQETPSNFPPPPGILQWNVAVLKLTTWPVVSAFKQCRYYQSKMSARKLLGKENGGLGHWTLGERRGAN